MIMTKLSVRILAALATAGMASPSPCQHGTDWLREHYRSMVVITLNGTPHVISLLPGSAGATAKLLDSNSVEVDSLSLPWHYNGGLAYAAPSMIAAGGLHLGTSRTGVLAHLRLTTPQGGGAPSLELVNASNFPGMDPVRMAWCQSAGGFFILDAVSNRVLLV